MKKGKYYIGDPCYLLREEQHEGFDWVNDFCRHFNCDDEVNVLGKVVSVMSTYYGDGEYGSNVDFQFPVDVGCIAAVPKSLWKGKEPPFGCLLVDFKEDFDWYSSNGTLRFGHIEIYTNDETPDEDCYCY